MSTTVAPAVENSTLSLPENSMAVLRRRYLRRGPDGQPVETVEGMFRRRIIPAVAQHCPSERGDVVDDNTPNLDHSAKRRVIWSRPRSVKLGR